MFTSHLVSRFCEDFEEMTGYYPNIVWRILWVFVTPLSLLGILLYSLVDQLNNPITYGRFVGCVVSNPLSPKVLAFIAEILCRLTWRFLDKFWKHFRELKHNDFISIVYSMLMTLYTSHSREDSFSTCRLVESFIEEFHNPPFNRLTFKNSS